MFSFQFNREFQIRNPGAYRVVARWFNHVPSWVGWLGGERYGPVEMELRLPRVSPGTEQTLLTTGLAPRQDRVFVRQTDAARIQIGFAHGEHDVQLSRPIVAAADAPHRLRVALGSLFPPEEFPASARWDGILGSKPARRLHIEWDGEPVLVGRQGFFPSSPGAVAISSGTTIAVRREGVARPEAETMCWRLRLRFPSAPGAEPLLRAERTGRVEQILVERAGEGAVRFRCVAEGGADAVSEVVPIELAAVHELEIRLTDETPRRRLTLKLDGQIAWAPRVTWGDWGTTTVAFGRAAGPDAGELFSAERFSGEVDPLMSSHGAMRLRVDFPRGRTGTREPLIVTGVTGRGDFLIVEYLDERRIRLIYDHWGMPSVVSEPLEIDHGAAHDLEVSFGALLAGPETRVTALGPLRRLRVKLDGRGVFDRPAEFHLAEPDEVAIGVNRIGGTSCGGRFTGGIRAVQRLPLAGLSATQ